MTIDTDHPDLAAEQSYVDGAYACLELMLDDVRAMKPQGHDELEKQAFERWRDVRIASLSDTRSVLVFGRIDERSGDTFYIGRHHVRDGRYHTVVTDWRAPVARAFYRAGARDPMGLSRRRQFLAEGREILGISDEDLVAETDGLRAADILSEELRRRRGPRMRDIVATIQAEQDVVIRAPLEGIVVVQGGPGTGKTSIGLHRAAFLLYEHRVKLRRRGVLVVGPNPVFIRYVSLVVPSLGEAVTQLPVDALAPSGAHEEPAPVARLKGDARMAEVIRRALNERLGVLAADAEITLFGVPFALSAAAVAHEARTLDERGVPYRKGREFLREQLVLAAYHAYADALPEGWTPSAFDDFSSALRKDAAFRKALDAVWPSVAPATLVDDLLASPSRLERASDGVLTAGERRALRRSRSAPRAFADGPLIDEARELIEGPGERYGHIVVDEAQDLSPMQLRMLARRCPEGSMTILGDLGQATGPWAHEDWGEVLGHLPSAQTHRSELTLGYRVSAEIMEVAAPILAQAAPRLRAPRAVRREPGEVVFLEATTQDRGARTAGAAREAVERWGTAALIVPSSLLDETHRALRKARVAFSDADRALADGLTVVPTSRAKGLEFDAVVVVEPARIVDEGGLRLLYVVLTRAMRALTVVHAEPLPGPMRASAAATV